MDFCLTLHLQPAIPKRMNTGPKQLDPFFHLCQVLLGDGEVHFVAGVDVGGLQQVEQTPIFLRAVGQDFVEGGVRPWRIVLRVS